MTVTKIGWLCISCAFCAAAAVTLAQTGAAPTTAAAPADAAAAIRQLKQAPNYQRAEARKAVVKFGQSAVPLLLSVVRDRQDAPDADLLSNCIIALGELKAAEATEDLLALLEGNNTEHAYLASMALGNIYEGKAGQDPAVPRVNGALLAFMLSDIPPHAVYGPGIALNKINGLGIRRPENMLPDTLKQQVSQWMASAGAALPPPDAQPWQLNLHAALTAADDASRNAALQALLQKRKLEPIEAILNALARPDLGQPVRAALAQVLGELTGEPFPPSSSTPPADPAQQVAGWRQLWLARLSRQSDPRHTQYSWNEFERALRRYQLNPTEATADLVKAYRSVVIAQLPGPEGMPPNASEAAKQLTTEALTVKKAVADVLSMLESAPDDPTIRTRLADIREKLRSAHRWDVGALFLARIHSLARQEQRQSIAAELGNLLWLISGVPCPLTASTLEERQKQLDAWLATARKVGLPIEAPAA